MMTGTSTTRESCVVHLAILAPLVLQKVLILVLEVAKYGWTTCDAWEMKCLWSVVGTMDGVITIVGIMKMHQSSAQVRSKSMSQLSCYY